MRFELGEALNFTLEAGLKITFGLREENLMVPERATFLLVPGRFDRFSDFLINQPWPLWSKFTPKPSK